MMILTIKRDNKRKTVRYYWDRVEIRQDQFQYLWDKNVCLSDEAFKETKETPRYSIQEWGII